MIFALERLRALRAGKTLDPPVLIDIDDLPIDWRIEFEERAAILEHGAGLSRDKADAQALVEIKRRIQSLGQD